MDTIVTQNKHHHQQSAAIITAKPVSTNSVSGTAAAAVAAVAPKTPQDPADIPASWQRISKFGERAKVFMHDSLTTVVGRASPHARL